MKHTQKIEFCFIPVENAITVAKAAKRLEACHVGNHSESWY